MCSRPSQASWLISYHKALIHAVGLSVFLSAPAQNSFLKTRFLRACEFCWCFCCSSYFFLCWYHTDIFKCQRGGRSPSSSLGMGSARPCAERPTPHCWGGLPTKPHHAAVGGVCQPPPIPPSFRGEGKKKTLTPLVWKHSILEHAFIYCPQSPFLLCPFIQYQMLTWPSLSAFGMADVLLCRNWTIWWFTCGLTRNPIQIWLWLLKFAALFQGKWVKLEGNESTMERCRGW